MKVIYTVRDNSYIGELGMRGQGSEGGTSMTEGKDEGRAKSPKGREAVYTVDEGTRDEGTRYEH